jgi:hypothetical protein
VILSGTAPHSPGGGWMRHNVLIALALAGCGNLRFDFQSGGAIAVPDADTDVMPTGGDCPASWPDVAIAAGACVAAPETDWTLLEKARSPAAGVVYFSVARFRDDDGDGDIDAGDRPSVLAQTVRSEVLLFDADLELVRTYGSIDGYSLVAAGAVDPTREGVQFLLQYFDGGARLGWFGPEPLDDTELPAPSGHMEFPWLTDLEGDGAPELLIANRVLSARDGTVLGALAGTRATAHVSADLDLDGVEEILGMRDESVTYAAGLWGADGRWIGTCVDSPEEEMVEPVFAVANLDGDAQGEFLVAGPGVFAICDHDGTLVRKADLGVYSPRVLGVGDLDGDGTPEIVFSDYDRLAAVDSDLTLLWETSFGMETWRPPFTLADLDGDGAHEILTQAWSDFHVIDGAGATLATFPNRFKSVFTAPAVVDLDGDGLSEILIAGEDGVVAVTNAHGGFAAPPPQEIWSHSLAVHPGDRAPDGTIPGSSDGSHWASSDTNVWQGLPPGTGNTFPELLVESVQICDVECGTTATVAVYVGNAGDRALADDVTVTVRSAGGSVVAEEILAGPHPPGVARAVVMEVSAFDLDDDLQVSLDHASSFPECGAHANVSAVEDRSCE